MKNRMNYLALVLLILLTPLAAAAQSTSNTPPQRLGLLGNVDLTMNLASFQQLPDVANCCPEFTSSTSLGWLLGLTYIKPFSSDLSLHLRLHYWSYGAAFTATETQPVVDMNGGPDEATIQHDLNASFQQISVEPLLGFTVAPDLTLLGGITAGYILSSTYDQKETLVTPTDATFPNLSRERNVLSGDIPDASVVGVGLTIGASYDLPLNEDRTMFLSPEILLTLSPFGPVSGVSWTAQHIRAGLALSFVPPEIEDSLTDQEFYEFTLGLTPPSKGTPGVRFVSNVSAEGLNADGTTSELTSISVEEFESRRIRPLLPYVFFDEESYTLSERYYRVDSDQRDGFSMSNFYNLDAMVTYHHVLNIVGRRMTDEPGASITLTGHATPEERGGMDLALERANAVRNYLVDVWGISASRITVNGKGLPTSPSNNAEDDGRAENRRVEITASSASILAPVESQDTIRRTLPEAIRFRPSIDPRVPIKEWRLFVARRGVITAGFKDGDPIPATVDWRLNGRTGVIPRGTTELSYLLAVSDTNNAVVPSATKRIPVSERRLDEKGTQTDSRVDRYSMILFGFDSAELTPEHRAMVDEVKKSITPSSTVSVTGYTDRTGTDAYNQGLSERRAVSVARELGLPSNVARGLGEALPLYDNNTPEGRFYSRTVEVTVETPKR